MIEVVYEDEYLLAVVKPAGLFVHQTRLDVHEKDSLIDRLKQQTGLTLKAPHRLDRKTSGLILLGKTKESVNALQNLFREREIEKTYYAIVRGFTEDEQIIDYALTNDSGKKQDAVTAFTTVSRSEIALAHGPFDTSRYSLLRVQPQTGRMHQIRKHMKHVRHPIIGDRPHGCNKQNRLLKMNFGLYEMMLHAYALAFVHPFTHQEMVLTAPFSREFLRMISELGLSFEKSAHLPS